jgi:pteridine reductase
MENTEDRKDALRVALVVGAGRRFGMHLSETLAREGYAVLMTARHSFEGAVEVVDRIRAQGGRAQALRSGASRRTEAAAIGNWAREKAAAWGARGVDLMVCNASVYAQTPVETAQNDEVEQILGSNLLGPFWLVQALLPQLRAVRGSVVCIGDAKVSRATPGYAVYGAAKLGLQGLVRSLAVESSPEVRVNMVSPGVMPWPQDTPEDYRAQVEETIPAGRVGAWDDLAQAVLMLSRMPYCTGIDLPVDGGWTCVTPEGALHLKNR